MISVMSQNESFTPFDTIVIGGGLLGCTAAQHLAQGGQRVALIDKGDLAGAASGINEGSLSAQTKPLALLEYALEGKKRWAEKGESVGYRPHPSLMLARSDEEKRVLEERSQLKRQQGLDIQLYSQPSLAKLYPYLSSQCKLAAYCKDDAIVNAALSGRYFRATLDALDVRLLEHFSVAAIHENDCGFTVLCEDKRLEAKHLLFATGAGTNKVTEMLALPVPLVFQINTVAITLQTDAFLPNQIFDIHESFSAQKQDNGKVVIASGWRGPEIDMEIRQAGVNPKILTDTIARCAAFWPEAIEMTLLASWHNIEANAPDYLPIVDSTSMNNRVTLLCAGRGGFMMGPYLAECAAKRILGQDCPNTLDKFSLKRFES